MNSAPGMGWIPDIPSVQDYTLDTPEISAMVDRNDEMALKAAPWEGGSAIAAAPALAAAPRVDLRQWFSPVEDQLGIGSCTAQSAVGLMEYFQRRACGQHLDASRLFVYKTTRNLLGWKGDTGAYIRTAMGALALFGAPPERIWPYVESKFDEEPPVFCYAFGASFKAVRYYRLDTAGTSPSALLRRIKDSLDGGFPAMFGFPVYDEFMNPEHGRVAYPARNSRPHGGHAIVAAGYDDNMTIGQEKGALLIRNSWGRGWGEQGYAWMSYRYITEGLALDWWSLLRSDWVETGQFNALR
jgi:C1A family cysteine protease